MGLKKYTHAEWKAEACRRFGDDPFNWKFVCPSCGYVASTKEWKDAGAPEGAVAFSCLGLYTGSTKKMGDKTGGPCNYTSGGLFNINSVEIELDGKNYSVFDFAESVK